METERGAWILYQSTFSERIRISSPDSACPSARALTRESSRRMVARFTIAPLEDGFAAQPRVQDQNSEKAIDKRGSRVDIAGPPPVAPGKQQQHGNDDQRRIFAQSQDQHQREPYQPLPEYQAVIKPRHETQIEADTMELAEHHRLRIVIAEEKE